MNGQKFGSIELLRLKYRRGDQIIQTFRKIRSLQKLGLPSQIAKNFKTLRKELLNPAEYIEMQRIRKNLGLENF